MADAADTNRCPLCAGPLTAGAVYCGRCEQVLQRVTPPAQPKPKWYYNTWVVLLTLTPFVLGPFGLFLLWKSPNFSKNAKVVLTLVTITWAVLFVVYFFQVVIPAVTQYFNQINSVLQF